MLTRSARRASAALALAAVATACGGSPSVPSPIEARTPQTGYTVRAYLADVSLKVGGDASLSFRGPLKIVLTEVRGGRIPPSAWFFQVGLSEPLAVEGARFQVAVDVAPGLYRGPGDYELTGAGVTPAVGGIGSSVFVRVFRLDAKGVTSAVDEFNVISGSCSLTVEAARGTLSCPALELSGETGKSVSLRWSWTL
ncbi:MAG: hypothetical protein HY775_06815 [Acidobacteria bacterium]|nr:hypothetical protein [Acidobacteriota bacterium]